ncbi:DUF4179 domain-containing protein [Peribacillus butanolivorans]|uniref:DUF4179 domain-containing protein n=1 Tax=Peribacillus butanolivorans TaxID=421767 RepID=UPI0036D7A0F1
MSKTPFRIGIAILALITIFMFCFTNLNDKTSAKEIERTLKTINKSASDNGITFTIGDVVKDGNERISLEYFIKSEKNLKLNTRDPLFVKPNIFINGKKINFSNTSDGQQEGKMEYRGVVEIEPKNELPNHYDVKFNFNQMLNQSGQWTIDFPL